MSGRRAILLQVGLIWKWKSHCVCYTLYLHSSFYVQTHTLLIHISAPEGRYSLKLYVSKINLLHHLERSSKTFTNWSYCAFKNFSVNLQLLLSINLTRSILFNCFLPSQNLYPPVVSKMLFLVHKHFLWRLPERVLYPL